MTALSDLVQPWLWAGFALFLRVGPVIALAPVFGEQAVPARLKLAAALAFTLVLLPRLAARMPVPHDTLSALGHAGAEVAVGLVFGLALRLVVLALMTAGSIIAQSISLAQIAGGGVTPEPAPAVGHLLLIGALALAATAGLHVKLAAFLLTSYDLVPPGHLPTPETVATAGLAATRRSLTLAVSLALPFVIGALLYNILLGVINRAMPQMMVTFVGAPLLVAGGLALLVVIAPVLIGLWSQALDGFLAAPFADPP